MVSQLVSRNTEVNKFRGIKIIHFWRDRQEKEISILLIF